MQVNVSLESANKYGHQNRIATRKYITFCPIILLDVWNCELHAVKFEKSCLKNMSESRRSQNHTKAANLINPSTTFN
jgi:hypothetical protein